MIICYLMLHLDANNTDVCFNIKKIIAKNVLLNNTSVTVILSISDELDYWKTVSQRKESSKKEREAASSFCELFEDISGEIR